MARKRRNIEKLTKIALICSILSGIIVIVVFGFILTRWNFKENLIFIGPRSKPLVLLLSMLACLLGFGGFWVGIEGASDGEGKTKLLGWLAFWIGVGATIIGIIAGLCGYFYAI